MNPLLFTCALAVALTATAADKPGSAKVTGAVITSKTVKNYSDLTLELRLYEYHPFIADKPAGLVVHPGAGNTEKTLVNALVNYCEGNLSSIGGELRPGIVHRLDKDTSGLLVIAKNDKAHKTLSKQFSNHGRDGKLIRSYKALVWGIPHLQSGKIETYLGRSLKNRKKIAIFSEEKKGRRFAITHWNKIKSNRELDISEIECNLETGRTHQIRVHLSHIGIPIIGDQVYGTGFKSKLNK